VTGDGVPEIITGAGAGGGPHVRIFEVRFTSGTASVVERASFLAYDGQFYGGVRVATADVDGNGVGEIVTAAGSGGWPHVRVFRLEESTITEFSSFLAYGLGFVGGVFIAGGDVDGDGRDDIITGPDAGSSPHVRVFALAKDGTASQLSSFLAYSPAFGGGVRVAAGDLDGDGVAEIITSPGRGGGPQVLVISRSTAGQPVLRASFLAFPATFTGGVFVAALPH
jgi:hypothetical protein